MTSRSKWQAVSGIPHIALGPWWFWRRGLRSRREADPWKGYGNNTTHPPDASSRQVGASDIVASRQIYSVGSDSRLEIKANEFHNEGGMHNI